MRLVELAVAAAITAAAILPSTAEAQTEPPARPQLESVADTNDWEAYYAAGMRTIERCIATRSCTRVR